MAHNKLYRNFIILQEDERGYSSSNDKSLSGYAKVEAKGDKCKVSFYAQNLKQDDNYSMVLICCKKDLKQLIDLGTLSVNQVGKGDTSREYYINNIAGLGISYEKISGAAICQINDGDIKVIMHGFMNGEEATENWRKFKIVRSESRASVKSEIKPSASINTSVKPKITENEPIEVKAEIVKNEENANLDLEIETADERNKEKKCDKDKEKDKKCEDKYKEKKCEEHKEKKCIEKVEEKCFDDVLNKWMNKLEDYDCDMDINIKNLKNDVMVCCFIKDKMDKKTEWKKYKTEKKCDCHREDEDLSPQNNVKRIDENLRLDRIDFDEYENSIKFTENKDDIIINGKVGEYFEDLAKGFEPYNSKFDDIKYCKWYKVNVNSMEDLCDKSNYNKYTLAYYPMLNYYPYISKKNHFLLGYKCDNSGNLKYIIYAVPGSKEKSDQPYGGKTGFVTWTNDSTRNNGYWLMFYDYKKCSIVVPTK